jgi:hypothetical protein
MNSGEVERPGLDVGAAANLKATGVKGGGCASGVIIDEFFTEVD